MPTSRTPRPAPSSSSDADLERNEANVAARIRDRGIELDGSESSDQLADLLSAIELFESSVGRRGGDNMVNTLQSSEPESEAFVLPERHERESIDAYTARIRSAGERLGRGTPANVIPGVDDDEDEA